MQTTGISCREILIKLDLQLSITVPAVARVLAACPAPLALAGPLSMAIRPIEHVKSVVGTISERACSDWLISLANQRKRIQKTKQKTKSRGNAHKAFLSFFFYLGLI